MRHTSDHPDRQIPTEMLRPVEMRALDLPGNEDIGMHAHEWGQFTYASEGVLTVTTPDGRYASPPATAVWIPPHMPHDIHSHGPVKFRSLYITTDRAADLPDRTTVVEVDPLLRALVLEVLNLSPDWSEQGADGRLIHVLLDRIARAPEALLSLPWPKDPRLASVADALIETPSDRRGLEDVAAENGTTARTLARRFKSETGLTFGEWRRRRILLAALERLSHGDAVTTIALDLGYDSPSAFIAMFRKSLGAAPTRYLQGAETRGNLTRDAATNGPR